MELSPGHMLRGRYHIDELVGKGGMGYIYRATDTHKNRTVAIKEMIQHNLSTEELRSAQERFKQEAEMLKTLSHPHLPKVYESFNEKGHSYLVMDFIHGKNLAELLAATREGKLPVDAMIDYALQLCDVFAYLHSRPDPIIFRDMKPTNVMVTTKSHVYLIDFGIARVFKPGKLMDTEFFGSLGFCPPEQLLAVDQTDARSDLYGLGATLYYCLSGQHPKENKPNVFNFASLHKLDPRIPINLDNLILNMVATDKGRRPPNAAIVSQHLKAIQLAAQGTTIDLRDNANAMGSYYDARMARQAQLQLQIKTWLNNLPLLAHRGWSSLYPLLLVACTGVGTWFMLSFIPFCVRRGHRAIALIKTITGPFKPWPGKFPRLSFSIPSEITPYVIGSSFLLLVFTAFGSFYLLKWQHRPLFIVVLVLCLLFSLMSFNATFHPALPIPARYGLAASAVIALLTCLFLIVQPGVLSQIMMSTTSNFLSFILIILALALLLRSEQRQPWLDHLAVIAIALSCALLAYNVGLTFSTPITDKTSLITGITVGTLFGLIALVELFSYRARFSRLNWFLVSLLIITYTAVSLTNLQKLINTFPSHITLSHMSVADSLKVIVVLLIAFLPLVIALVALFQSSTRSYTRHLVIPVLAIACMLQQQLLDKDLALLGFPTNDHKHTLAGSLQNIFSTNQFVVIGLVLLALWLLASLFTRPRRSQLDYAGLLSLGIIFILLQRSLPDNDVAASGTLFPSISTLPDFPSYLMPAIILLLIFSVAFLFILLITTTLLHATTDITRLPTLIRGLDTVQPLFGRFVLFLCTLISLWLQWFFGDEEPWHNLSLTGQQQGGAFDVPQCLFFLSVLVLIVSFFLLFMRGKSATRQQKSAFPFMARLILCYNALVGAFLLFNIHKNGALSVQATLQWLGVSSLSIPPLLINIGLLLIAFILLRTASTSSSSFVSRMLRILAAIALLCTIVEFFVPAIGLLVLILLMQHVRLAAVTTAPK
jgi:tRNA A-37 threonylcarbamoyl transferase component Bud32